ncbi:MAG TPA: ABC transporter permease [Candidatus Acidoferrum sp.]|nr:ABC transporter permease [Candidatus Acidoferrum sp.]
MSRLLEFAKPKLAFAVSLLAVFHGAVLFAGFFAPYDFAAQDRDLPFAPPTAVHFEDAQGRWHARPFVRAFADDPANPAGYIVDPGAEYPVHFFVKGTSYKVLGVFTLDTHLFGVDDPGRIFLMGTDSLGRDQFSRFLFGGQLSLLAGTLAALLSVSLGIVIGGAAGYFGGWLDDLLMRGGELFLALPWLYLLFAVRAALPLHVSQAQVFLLLVAVVGLVGWARPARLIRGVVLSAKERDFVTAARGFGASHGYLFRRHILPGANGVILTQLALLIPQYILAEVTLTFLGLGVGEPMASWGTLLSSLQQYYVLSTYWWMFLPAVLLVPLFLAYYTAADAVQERVKSVAV